MFRSLRSRAVALVGAALIAAAVLPLGTQAAPVLAGAAPAPLLADAAPGGLLIAPAPTGLISPAPAPQASVDLSQLVDLTGDGVPELVLGTKGSSRAPGKLTVYARVYSLLAPVGDVSYDRVTLSDVNGDGRDEIVTLNTSMTGESGGPATLVDVYGVSGQELKQLSEVKLEGWPQAVTVGQAWAVGQTSAARAGLFVETLVGAHSGLTALLLWDSEAGGLSPSFADPYDVTFKPHPLPSGDVNGDGVVEMGIEVAPPGSDDVPLVAMPWIQQWHQWDGKQGLGPVVAERYADPTAGFQFSIPAAWRGLYTIKGAADGPAEGSTEALPEVSFVYVGADGKQSLPLLTLRQVRATDLAALEPTLTADGSVCTILQAQGGLLTVGVTPPTPTVPTGSKPTQYQSLLLSPEQLLQAFTVVGR